MSVGCHGSRSALFCALTLAFTLACGEGAGTGGGATSGPSAKPTPHLEDASTPNGTQVVSSADLATTLEPIRAKYRLPSLAAVVVSGASIAASGAVGVRELGAATPVGVGDRYHTGGAIQTFTATLAATVVEDGRLSWTTTLGAALPDVPMSALYQYVTLEDLLAQRGGAPATIPDDVTRAARVYGDPRGARDAAVRALLAQAPEVSPGTFHESDASFLLANAMLERATGASWEELMAVKIYRPLGIETCGVVADIGPVPSVPWGHTVSSDVASPIWPGFVQEPPLSFAPALGLRCSLMDWAKLVALHLAGARGETTALLRPPSFEELQTPVDATHARGWYAVSRAWAGADLALNYASRDPAIHTLSWVLPSKNLALVIAVNEGSAAASDAADEAVATLVGMYAPQD